MFNGVGVALVTPFNQDLTVDYAALEQLVAHVIDGGVNYLVALGTTAETPTLSSEEKIKVLEKIIQFANKRVPVVVGIGGNNTQEVIDTIKQYPLAEVAGILSVAPYYNKPSQEGMYQHFKAIASSTDKPIILYNVPGRTSSNLLPDTVVRLANEFSNIVAIKEASGNLVQCMEMVQKAPQGFSVLSGDDNLILAQASVGFVGVISVAANAYPKQFCTLVNAALEGDFAAARKAHYALLPAINLLFAEGNPAGVKYALHKAGVVQNVLRLPLIPASQDLQNQFNALPF